MSVSLEAKNASTQRGRQASRRLLILLCGLGLVAGGWVWWTYRRYQRAMFDIQSQMMGGQYAIACRNLDQLLSWKADPTGRIAFLLGYCELERGRYQAAHAAWARVAPGSLFSENAVEGRVHLFQESGQYAAAEQTVLDAAQDPRNDRTALLVLLVPVFRLLGRIEEAERLVENRWERLNASRQGAAEPAIRLVRQHIELTLQPEKVETLRGLLDQASQRAPDDDRVWLGRANLAIRTGDLIEAKRWLDACQERRPEDVPVWRARLNWGIETNQTVAVERALEHIPATEWSLARSHQIHAWLAAHRGDVATERRELELQVAADPADMTALGRLAELAVKEGQPAPTAELAARKTEIDRVRTRYLQLHERTQPFRDAEDLARLAGKLGRWFEARAFLTIAIAEDPSRGDLWLELKRLSTGQAMTSVATDHP